jgi:uncharacterized protein (TIGR02996 family)
MSEEAALLNAIYANHDEDTPRLIYADWLDEHGRHDQAEFIRVQIRLEEIHRTIPCLDEMESLLYFGLSRAAGVWHCPRDSAERRELAYRCRCLLDIHEANWLTPHQELLHNEWSWHRGFLDTVEVNAVNSLQSVKQLFRQHPVRRMILSGAGQHLAALEAIPADNCLSSLEFILHDFDIGTLSKLAQVRQLTNLT